MSDEEADAGSPRFTFESQGLVIDIDETDNEAGHSDGLLYSDAGIVAEFTVTNAGTAEGSAAVALSDAHHAWAVYPIDNLRVGGASGGRMLLGRMPPGHYDFTATVSGGDMDVSVTTGVDVHDPSSPVVSSGSPHFVFGKEGLSIEADPVDDGVAGSTILYTDAGICAIVTVHNVGTAPGVAQVWVTDDSDDKPLGGYTTQTLRLRDGVEPAYVPLGRLSAGTYSVTATLGPVETLETGDIQDKLTRLVLVQDPSGASAIAGGPNAGASSAPSSAPAATSSPAPGGVVA